jgi:hypothetical protein
MRDIAMKNYVIWATALVLCVAALADRSSRYYVEEAKQRAFMLKSCVEAGGSWSIKWGNPDCARPR